MNTREKPACVFSMGMLPLKSIPRDWAAEHLRRWRKHGRVARWNHLLQGVGGCVVMARHYEPRADLAFAARLEVLK